jgi:hypothetical protein
MVVLEERDGQVRCNGWMTGACESCDAIWCPRDGEPIEDEKELSGKR